MAIKYYGKTRTYKTDALYYELVYYVSIDSYDAETIPLGTLATWAPTPAYVVGFEAKPCAQHYKVTVTARDAFVVTQDKDAKGRTFKKTFFVLDADLAATLPLFGSTATWAPVSSYVSEYKVERCGPNWFLIITAVEDGYNLLGG